MNFNYDIVKLYTYENVYIKGYKDDNGMNEVKHDRLEVIIKTCYSLPKYAPIHLSLKLNKH